MVGSARKRDGSVTPMTALGSLILIETIQALAGLDATILDASEDVSIADSDVLFVEAKLGETVIRGRPWVPHKRVATISKGVRLAVRGTVESRDNEGCSGKTWYAVWPFGFVCSKHVKPTEEAPVLGAAMPLPPGRRLPHAYALVRSQTAPQYKNLDDAVAGIVEKNLAKGMSLVVHRTLESGGVSYIELKGGRLVPKADVGWMGQGSEWRGVRIENAAAGPLVGWIHADKTKVRDDSVSDAEVIATLSLRDRVRILERKGDWRKVELPKPDPDEATAQTETPASGWVRDGDINEIVIIDPPNDVVTDFRLEASGNDQWFDVDVGEQVLVAYRGNQPFFATMVSSGRGSPTPLGNYPVWAKVASMDMGNQDYEDRPYLVQGVPWVVLFQGHIALHGAYWHNRFGNRKSHGCVNLAPLDAKFVFDWVGPTLPFGWTGYLPEDLHASAVVHVRDSSRESHRQFTQERAWGPPDRAAERKKTEAALSRRAKEAEALLGDLPSSPADFTPPVTRISPPRPPGTPPPA